MIHFFHGELCLFWSIQREEEQAREREKAEQIRQERELLAQKEEAARQARKKVTSMNTCDENVNPFGRRLSAFIGSLMSKAPPSEGSDHLTKPVSFTAA